MEEGDHLERGGRIILKCLLQKLDRKALAELVGLRIEVMALVNTIMKLRVPSNWEAGLLASLDRLCSMVFVN